MNSNGNLPAMPVIEESKSEQYNGATHTTATAISFGLTKREQFAMAAMQGILSGFAASDIANTAKRTGVTPDNLIPKMAVELADALLAELERTK